MARANGRKILADGVADVTRHPVGATGRRAQRKSRSASTGFCMFNGKKTQRGRTLAFWIAPPPPLFVKKVGMASGSGKVKL